MNRYNNKNCKNFLLLTSKLWTVGIVGVTTLTAACIVNQLNQNLEKKSINSFTSVVSATASANCFFSGENTAPTGTITYDTSDVEGVHYVTITKTTNFSGTNLSIKDPITFEGDENEYHLLALSARAFRSCSNLYGIIDLSSNYLTSLGFAAFDNCKNLESVILPSSLQTIGDNAFQNTPLNSVDFSNCTALSSIGAGAFSGSGIKVLDLSKCTSLTTITKQAFFHATLLTSIELPNTVTTIGSSAFYWNESLTSINFGKTNIETIEDNAFGACPILAYNFPSTLTSIGLAALNISSCQTITFLNDDPSWVDSEKTTNIFVGDPQQTIKIQVPYGKSDAYETAFAQCVWFETDKMSVAELSNIYTSKPSRFFEYSSATEADSIKYMVSAIGTDPQFLDVTDAASIIATDCKLRAEIKPGEIAIPIRNISAQAFMNATGLTGSFDMSENNDLVEIQDNAFDGCTGLTSVTLSKNLTSIGESAFSNCEGLVSIDTANSLKIASIGDYAFASCTNLKSIDLANNTLLTTLGAFAFRSCTNLESFTLPSTMTNISEGAFSHCTKLTSLDLTKYENTSLTSIGDYAFAGCSGLYHVSIPSSITSIGKDAFSTCCMQYITFYNNDASWLESNGVGDNWLGGWYSYKQSYKLTFEVSTAAYFDYSAIMTNETLTRWGLDPSDVTIDCYDGPIPPSPTPLPPTTDNYLSLILGLSLGLGIPVVAGATTGIVLGIKHKKSQSKTKNK